MDSFGTPGLLPLRHSRARCYGSDTVKGGHMAYRDDMVQAARSAELLIENNHAQHSLSFRRGRVTRRRIVSHSPAAGRSVGAGPDGCCRPAAQSAGARSAGTGTGARGTDTEGCSRLGGYAKRPGATRLRVA